MKRRFLILILFFVAHACPTLASHIVGGEVTYVCLGMNRDSTYNYTVSVIIYEDCLNGDPVAIASDNPAILSLYDGVGNRIDTVDISSANVPIPVNFSNSCISNVPRTCLQKKTFTHTFYNLPANNTGYLVAYQRCCRNASILNIVDPSNVGATYFCAIPPVHVAVCNNSAVFKNYPPQIICINNPLVYDNSATDADGDSLSYELCNTYEGGDQNDIKPIPLPPPYFSVPYAYPFSYSNPMGGYPRIQIDAATGLITGTPNRLGRYVVTVCCHEWREGKLINTLKREFQFVVTNCSKTVVANMPQYSNEPNTYIVNCKDYSVNFVNISQGGFAYKWDFGVPGATSTEFEPTYTYPDTGVYVVKLIVNPGSTCTDSISRIVKIYPSFRTDYQFNGMPCPGSVFNFTDLTNSTYRPINYWNWNFGDGTTSADSNATHIFNQGGTFRVVLTSRNLKGCSDTMLKTLIIERFKPFAGNDTVIVKGEHINFNATGGEQYTWTPADQLTDTSIPDPIGYYPDTGTYRYNLHVVSSFGCVGDDSITVLVVNQAAAFVPNAFTPNGDGLNDRFRPVLIGYRAINSFRIFDRWGQEVYFTRSVGDGWGWDGTFNGKALDMGTYFWLLDITDKNGKGSVMHGDVTLIR